MTMHNGTYTRWTKEECHSGNVLAFTTHDGIEVWAGGSSRSGGWWLLDPLPDLAMGPDNEVKKGYNRLKVDSVGKNMEGWKVQQFFVEREPPAVIELDFPDFGVPMDCPPAFWETLVLDIREQGVKAIHAMCMGGHGRTGIQLACLRWHLATEEERKAWPDANALIAEVRTHYCNKAVEGEKQQRYVAWVCDIPVGDTLGFHKVSYSSDTKWNGGTTKTTLTAHSRGLLECSKCDFCIWEDLDVVDIREDDPCLEPTCTGKMIDVTDLLVKTSTAGDSDQYAICLSTLDVCSVPSALAVGPLTVGAMETWVGKNWPKILDRAMSQNSKVSTRGKMIRQLNDALNDIESDYETDGMDSEGVLVVYTTASCDPRVDEAKTPDWSNKKERGGKEWTSCGFCAKNVSPDRLVAARKVNKDGDKLHTICPDCMTSSGLEFETRMHTVGGMHVTIDEDKVYRIVDGVSPQGVLVTATLRVSADEKYGVIDDKQIQAGLEELGLTKDEMEGYYDAVGDDGKKVITVDSDTNVDDVIAQIDMNYEDLEDVDEDLYPYEEDDDSLYGGV